MEPGEALALLDSMDKELLDSPAVTKEIIGDRPNTYTFTKVENYCTTLCRLAFLDLDFYWDKYVHVIILGECMPQLHHNTQALSHRSLLHRHRSLNQLFPQ